MTSVTAKNLTNTVYSFYNSANDPVLFGPNVVVTGDFTGTALEEIQTLASSGALNMNPGVAPVNTVLPTVTGTAQVGQTLTRTNGTWTGNPAPTLTTQWKADGANISGANGATYIPVVGDVGKVITVTVTGTNTSGSASATSTATAAVIA